MSLPQSVTTQSESDVDFLVVNKEEDTEPVSDLGDLGDLGECEESEAKTMTDELVPVSDDVVDVVDVVAAEPVSDVDVDVNVVVESEPVSDDATSDEDSTSSKPAIAGETETATVVVEEETCLTVKGKYIGQCKWFNDLLGYGFVTICEGQDKGKDIFVHHSGIKPLNSNYKTLRKGEYLHFNIITGINGLQAVDVTGINGGPLMCDFVSVSRTTTTNPQASHRHMASAPSVPTSSSSVPAPGQSARPGKTLSNMSQWYVVTKSGRKKNLAKYSKDGRTAMKMAKQAETQG